LFIYLKALSFILVKLERKVIKTLNFFGNIDTMSTICCYRRALQECNVTLQKFLQVASHKMKHSL